ncbi:MAG: ABC transporter substrate-binding protein, partial [Candidatus Promineifilaceae bacterium]
LEWVALGEDATAYNAAIQGGQIDVIYSGDVGPDSFLALKDNPDISIAGIPTSNARIWRMRQDQDPWTDINVVNAVKKTQDREKILAAAFFDEGIIGYDTHISPVHPAWSPMDVPAYDPEGAKALLAEAGLESLDFAVSVGTGWPDIVAFAETVQQDAKEANINITLDTMPNAAFWDLWSETTVGVTPWTHRPLAVMLLPLAYIGDADGNPVPWNETRWIDQEFMDILKEAQGTLDVEARRVLTGQLQQIQQERNAVLVSYFMNVWQPVRKNIKGVDGHPTNYNLWQHAWVEGEA